MTAQQADRNGPVAFFREQHEAFAETLRRARTGGHLIDALLTQAYDSFDRNVEIQAEGLPLPVCRKGCATCCTLRVTATAPEALMIGRYVRWMSDRLKSLDIDLAARVAAADRKTRGMDERRRVRLRQRCPFVQQGVCLIYQVRPLACRGHASYDVRACAEAAAGRTDEIPYSAPHRTVRSLVQNAMQSELRDAGLAFGLYELNHAVVLALQDESGEQAWLGGEDFFAAAAIAELSQQEMAHAYDAIHAL